MRSRKSGVSENEGFPIYFTNHLGDNDFQKGHSYYFPMKALLDKPNSHNKISLFNDDEKGEIEVPNLSDASKTYLNFIYPKKELMPTSVENSLWLHVLSIGYSPLWLNENAEGIRFEWPRVPLPRNRDDFEKSANLGAIISKLLNFEIDPEKIVNDSHLLILKKIGNIQESGGGQLDPNSGHLKITAGWGRLNKEGKVMPGNGRIGKKRGIVGIFPDVLGEEFFDIYLNQNAFWSNVPKKVWEFTLGGYQVVKKYLSYRESFILGRDLTPEEVSNVTQIFRRITAILLLGPELDNNYRSCKNGAYPWPNQEI